MGSGNTKLIAVSKETKKRLIIEVIHPLEANHGERYSFDKAVKVLLDAYKNREK